MTRSEFLRYLLTSLTAVVVAFAAGCSSAPDAETEASPEWSPDGLPDFSD